MYRTPSIEGILNRQTAQGFLSILAHLCLGCAGTLSAFTPVSKPVDLKSAAYYFKSALANGTSKKGTARGLWGQMSQVPTHTACHDPCLDTSVRCLVVWLLRSWM